MPPIAVADCKSVGGAIEAVRGVAAAGLGIALSTGSTARADPCARWGLSFP
jgi:hypothetical protein